jgi:tetratricopeptide (TPR) repeat protein
MPRELTDRYPLFRPAKPKSNLYRIWLWVLLILVGIWSLLQIRSGQIEPLFQPTPAPTRSAQSYVLEAQAYFDAGKLDDPNTEQDAIGAYQAATQVDPQNAQTWAELARIQTYSSATVNTDNERLKRLQEALIAARKGAELAPDDSTVQAILAFVLDWNASSNLITSEQHDSYLNEAEQRAARAYNLDPNNVLALAYYAEVMLDQNRWTQAKQFAEQALIIGQDLMDVHRVYANVLESVGLYRDAIAEYEKAAEITPNMTFLYLRIGLVYRNLGNKIAEKSSIENALPTYEQALTYFDRAARINEQLGVRDPQPYIAIAKTYTQMGEFFVASRNAEKALRFDPKNPNTYGQLGMIYVQAKNYEFALPMLQCAVEGCQMQWLVPPDNPESVNAVPCMDLTGCNDREKATAAFLFGADGFVNKATEIQPLELTNLEVAYYYIRYGSVLAYLRRPGDGNCEKVFTLMEKLRQAPNLGSDPFLLQNAESNEILCQRLMGTPTP